MKYGDARYPMQYNQNHFTFVSDENGISNRWAGFFSTQTGGLDTLYYIGEDILHNPIQKKWILRACMAKIRTGQHKLF